MIRSQIGACFSSIFIMWVHGNTHISRQQIERLKVMVLSTCHSQNPPNLSAFLGHEMQQLTPGFTFAGVPQQNVTIKLSLLTLKNNLLVESNSRFSATSWFKSAFSNWTNAGTNPFSSSSSTALWDSKSVSKRTKSFRESSNEVWPIASKPGLGRFWK